MSKPTRIIRRAPQAADVPAVSDAATAETHSDTNVCRICGVHVVDTERHQQFHADIYKVSVWMWRVNELLRTNPDREDLPTDGEGVSSTGEGAVNCADSAL
ncbi:hypothetical protein [Nocardia beijingensis]|uniref:hypothetical protein n=1 Tax=Nocardia beijingensis TaxID=95162 RepID=UPI0033BDEF0D